MAGVKGRTGKRSTIQDMSLLTMTTSWLVANWYSFTKEEKMKVALIIAPRGIADRKDITITHTAEDLIERFDRAMQPNAN